MTQMLPPSLRPADAPATRPQGPAVVALPAEMSASQSAAAAAQARTQLRAHLRAATKPIHEQLTGHDFFVALIGQTLSRAQLAGYLVDQNHVLGALEKALLPLGEHPAVQPMVRPEVVCRQELAAQDVANLHVVPLPDPTPAACRLAVRIGQLGDPLSCSFCPEALAVQAYTQYNAMLSGGQQLARAVSRLNPGSQLKSLAFDPPADVLRGSYAEAINDIDYAGVEIEALCREAQWAFATNEAMLTDVMRRREGSIAALSDDLRPPR